MSFGIACAILSHVALTLLYNFTKLVHQHACKLRMNQIPTAAHPITKYSNRCLCIRFDSFVLNRRFFNPMKSVVITNREFASYNDSVLVHLYSSAVFVYRLVFFFFFILRRVAVFDYAHQAP